MNEHDDKKVDALRDAYDRLPKEAPGEFTDARIRAEAHRAVKPRKPAGWIGVVALAASIGFAVVMVPSLLLEKPAPKSPDDRFLAVESAPAVTKEETELERVQITASRIRRADIEDSAKAADAERPAVVLSEETAQPENPAARTMAAPAENRREAFVAAERSRLMSLADVQAIPDADALREELAGADELEWRATLVTLRDNDRRALAEQLMPEYRSRFELDDSLTLDMLVAEVN